MLLSAAFWSQFATKVAAYIGFMFVNVQHIDSEVKIIKQFVCCVVLDLMCCSYVRVDVLTS